MEYEERPSREGRRFGGGGSRGGFRGGSGGGSFGGPREMHKATCSECGKECEVPFKPSNGPDGKPRPVFCRDCYAKRKPARF